MTGDFAGKCGIKLSAWERAAEQIGREWRMTPAKLRSLREVGLVILPFLWAERETYTTNRASNQAKRLE
jgi:hypothetical protein